MQYQELLERRIGYLRQVYQERTSEQIMENLQSRQAVVTFGKRGVLVNGIKIPERLFLEQCEDDSFVLSVDHHVRRSLAHYKRRKSQLEYLLWWCYFIALFPYYLLVKYQSTGPYVAIILSLFASFCVMFALLVVIGVVIGTARAVKDSILVTCDKIRGKFAERKQHKLVRQAITEIRKKEASPGALSKAEASDQTGQISKLNTEQPGESDQIH